MDIFQFASLANNFTNELWICLLVGALCFVIVYIFQGMGLYTIAGHEGYTHRWMAWVPFLQLYYIGVCAQKNKVMNSMDTRMFAIAVAILDIVMFVGYSLYYVSYFLVEDYIMWEPVYYTTGTDVAYYTFGGWFNTIPEGLGWAQWIYQYLYNYILIWFELIFIVLKLFLYTSFYRTYSSRRYVLFSVVGALLPVNGIIIYCVRNNKGLNYNDYIRKVREDNYRRYQQQQQQNMYNQNPYSRGYGAPPPQNDPYNTNNVNNNASQGSAASDPFEEYGNKYNTNNNNNGSSSDDSPFEDF
ncbi:MAG: hypothetical protein LUD19_06590 [Clostridia bacterium]|nr:hypothetical protein [Clostridia bacterium]